MRFVSILLLALLACARSPVPAAPVPRPGLVDDTVQARRALLAARDSVRTSRAPLAERVRGMIRLGMWSGADSLLAAAPARTDAVRVAEAELWIRRGRFRAAEALVDSVLEQDPRNGEAALLRARLLVQAWRLDDAERALLADGLLQGSDDPRQTLLLGRIRLLQKRYAEAGALAERVLRRDGGTAAAYLLLADVRFWAQDPASAEAPLRLSLALDPWDPDARFAYGYAIWRRVDARQLPAMAAQWQLALELDPLHYRTHWHWGNGHTQLTYADYAQPEDSAVRVRLAPADSLVAAGRIDEAVAQARQIETAYTRSVLPAMLRASAWYLAAHGPERAARLDSAEVTFRRILAAKAHYGPAHNGLAAVIKQRQMEYLADYDSLEAAIHAAPLPRDSAFYAVFRDAAYYPGSRVQQMAALEIGPAAAYLPLLRRLGEHFTIPPLHEDLARAMGSPYFRTATTFDNRQWMDIRGVGGGAAGIEYVERGAHQERNVLLHEYVHLFHTTVLTDAEQRRIRALYNAAARDSAFLDYYAANNEHEFLAQGYEAFLSPVKVHPLNHKAANTRAELFAKDPAQAAFLDSLVRRDRAFLAGDTAAFRSNWAQVYVTLAERALAGREPDRLRSATALLDSALFHDARYLPALVRMAGVLRQERRWADAKEWLARAAALDSAYAPVLRERARLLAARGEGVDAPAAVLRRAFALETDPMERAEIAGEEWTMMARYARVPEAIRAARLYADSAPAFSTYLRDARDEAAAFAAGLRALAGYAAETLPFWAELVGRKPQDYDLRAGYADALLAAGRPAEALGVLREGQRILAAGGRPSPEYAARIAEVLLLRGDTAGARRAAAPVVADTAPSADLRAARVLAALDQTAASERRLAAADSATAPAARAELWFTRGWIAERRGAAAAERAYRAALAQNPYELRARLRLARLLTRGGRGAEARALADAAARLPLPPGPDAEVAGGSPGAK